MSRLTRHRALVPVTVVAAAALVAGCGNDDFKNEPRPPASITLSASVSDARVTVSPARIGAGPISLIVTNQTDSAQDVTLRRTDGPQGAEGPQATGPINPNDTASLHADLVQGTYTLSTRSDTIDPATIDVGRARKSAQDLLLQP